MKKSIFLVLMLLMPIVFLGVASQIPEAKTQTQAHWYIATPTKYEHYSLLSLVLLDFRECIAYEFIYVKVTHFEFGYVTMQFDGKDNVGQSITSFIYVSTNGIFTTDKKFSFLSTILFQGKGSFRFSVYQLKVK